MRLYYTAETNIDENVNITGIGFIVKNPMTTGIETVIISGELCEVSRETDRKYISGRWKGDIAAIVEDDMGVSIESIADLISLLGANNEVKMLEYEPEDAEGYIQLTSLRLEDGDGESYTFPVTSINITIIIGDNV